MAAALLPQLRMTEQQIELVKTFADQAVIAIENVRLLDELRRRTDDLGRSVEELRALGEVSQAVNSTLDLETVLSTIGVNEVDGPRFPAAHNNGVLGDAYTQRWLACVVVPQ